MRLSFPRGTFWLVLLLATVATWAAEVKIRDLTESTSPTPNAVFHITTDPSGTPLSRKVSLTNAVNVTRTNVVHYGSTTVSNIAATGSATLASATVTNGATVGSLTVNTNASIAGTLVVTGNLTNSALTGGLMVVADANKSLTSTTNIVITNNLVSINRTNNVFTLDVNVDNSGGIRAVRSSSAPSVVVENDVASPGADVGVGTFSFIARDSAANRTVYGQINGHVTSSTDGAESAYYAFTVIDAGTLAERTRFDGRGVLLRNVTAPTVFPGDTTRIYSSDIAGGGDAGLKIKVEGITDPHTIGTNATFQQAVTVGGALTGATKINWSAGGSATLDFGSISAAASADLTITVTGAATGDTVAIGLPAAPTAGIVFNAFVSASNTVTVRASNITGSPVDPASASYSVRLFRN